MFFLNCKFFFLTICTFLTIHCEFLNSPESIRLTRSNQTQSQTLKWQFRSSHSTFFICRKIIAIIDIQVYRNDENLRIQGEVRSYARECGIEMSLEARKKWKKRISSRLSILARKEPWALVRQGAHSKIVVRGSSPPSIMSRRGSRLYNDPRGARAAFAPARSRVVCAFRLLSCVAPLSAGLRTKMSFRSRSAGGTEFQWHAVSWELCDRYVLQIQWLFFLISFCTGKIYFFVWTRLPCWGYLDEVSCSVFTNLIVSCFIKLFEETRKDLVCKFRHSWVVIPEYIYAYWILLFLDFEGD